MANLNEVKPQEVIKHFVEIEKIPRESGNEKEISDFLVKFGKDRGFEVHQDKALNVIIKKPGTKGYENSKPVIIQGHMDMVCEKAPDSNHDFSKDPLDLYVDGDLLRARGTTLGADNGIAVAMAMALLDSNDIPHPPLEVLITTAEETGMDGAQAVDGKMLDGKILLNIDTENDDEFVVSCAGGAEVESKFTGNLVPVSGEAIKISISGYSGGHSGTEINKQRGNAISHIGRLLFSLVKTNGFNLVSIIGGSKHNAIALSSEAIITVKDRKEAIKVLEEVKEGLLQSIKISDPTGKITIEETSTDGKMFDEKSSEDIARFLHLMPYGVQEISLSIKDLVQTSLNLGVLRQNENIITLETSVRGSFKASMDYLIDKVIETTKLCGGEAEILGRYPAWEYEIDSKVRDTAVSVYKRLRGEEPKVNAIHAGLECGLLKGQLPDCEMISFGPNITDAHTHFEALSLSSTEKSWEFTKELLKELK